ncbi:uncharacterized protein LOC143881125 [Tasmannia lanceolata]|uniref:uncharacterized protein LOC143881125 n=1 Tax=Tasmannia lanceolata TaxID=3420 RepID=UPI0040640BC4
MASNHCLKTLICLAFTLALCVRGALGAVTCEDLDKSTCAFAVSSAGMRCLLEKHVTRGQKDEYTCRTSEITADKLTNWIESDQCVEACGVDRNSLGISSDSLLESHFTKKLCSCQCYQGCPNIVDLYFNVAAGEGVFLPKLCEAQGTNARREMAEIQSSGIVAPLPDSGLPRKLVALAPTMSPL